jgi:hypothetical protein
VPNTDFSSEANTLRGLQSRVSGEKYELSSSRSGRDKDIADSVMSGLIEQLVALQDGLKAGDGGAIVENIEKIKLNRTAVNSLSDKAERLKRTLTAVLNVFDGIAAKIEHKMIEAASDQAQVDWRPDETLPEDYYARSIDAATERVRKALRKVPVGMRKAVVQICRSRL